MKRIAWGNDLNRHYLQLFENSILTMRIFGHDIFSNNFSIVGEMDLIDI